MPIVTYSSIGGGHIDRPPDRTCDAGAGNLGSKHHMPPAERTALFPLLTTLPICAALRNNRPCQVQMKWR